MEGSSSFAHIDAPGGSRAQRLARSCFAALEGAAAAIPSSLGCVILVFGVVAPQAIGSGVLAMMIGLAWIHLVTAGHSRPVGYSGRIFEATTLAAMIEQLVPQLAGWGVADGVGVRLAFVCAIGGGGGLVVALLFLLRAERLTPYIPTPVFAGFCNSIALALIVSQSRSLWQLASGTTTQVVAVLTTVIVGFGTAYAVRRWLPGRPGAAVGLVAGLAAGLAWTQAGQPLTTVGGGDWSVPLPFTLADFAALAAPGVKRAPLVFLLVGNSAILGVMIFINTAMAAQTLTQFDGRRPARGPGGLVSGIALASCGAAGATTISGSILTSLAVARTASVNTASLLLLGATCALVYLTGVLAWMPLAAVIGVLLCEAWFLVDRPSLRLLVDWLRRRPLAHNAREDLALVAAVTALAAFVNMVVAAFGGLVLGLFLVALRSARHPVRHVWTGAQVSSNCARSGADLRVLAEHGAALRVFELEGDMFFAVGASLDRALQEQTEDAACVVLDWSRVRHIDSSVASTLAAFGSRAAVRGLFVVHAGAADLPQGNVAGELRRRLPGAHFAADLDYALELAENQLIRLRAGQRRGADDISTLFEAVTLFSGFDPAERALLEEAMTHKVYRAGEVILRAGEMSDELMLVVQGSASVVVSGQDGQPMRLAGVRRGAILGEVGFLDGSPRSATVLAQDDVLVAILTRAAYDRLAASTATLVPKLLANMAVSLA
ncbi:MAG TPA: cyclic nucleotide-binding domain-containing protein, partial [Ramlibacter sp.]|nr:cyclic nucleotide-binding domain-containing protein [Ramlibacter sp.]